MGSFGIASEEELLLTKKLFWGIFDSLSQKVEITDDNLRCQHDNTSVMFSLCFILSCFFLKVSSVS